MALLHCLWLSDIPLYVYVPHLSYPFLCQWTFRRIPGTGEPGGLPSVRSHRVGHDWSNLAAAAAACLVYYSAACIGVHVSFQIMIFSKYTPRSGSAGSYCGFSFSFLRILHTVLHNGCTNLYTYSIRGCPFLHTLSNIYCRFFDDGHSHRCEVIPHCSFEFILLCGVRECSDCILLHVAVQFSQHHMLKRLSFLHGMFLPPL